MISSYLTTIIIIFALAIFVLLICYRFNIPSIVGFLITGVITGPSGLKLVTNINEVKTLADIGIILLLFTIGVEFSFKNIKRIKKIFFFGGTLQILLTIFAIFFISYFYLSNIPQAIFTGFLISLSSTAIILKVLEQNSEIESPHGRISLGISIFQDLASVIMILFIPIIAGQNLNITRELILLLVKCSIIAVVMIALTKWVIPKLFFIVAKTKSNELFVLTIIVICFSIAWATSNAGLSIALGAFLAGLIFSETEYGYQALSTIIPFKDIFSSIFFISIGMLFDIKFFISSPINLILITLIIVIIKFIIAGIIPLLLGFPLRTMILTGFVLAQVGEFSFILANRGVDLGLLNKTTYQFFLGVSILSMTLTPFLIRIADKIYNLICKLKLPSVLLNYRDKDYELNEDKIKYLNDHIIIVGYGINGQNVARAAKAARLNYIIIEINPETVQREKKKGEFIFYGDASQETVLLHANILKARVMVIGIPDILATRRIVEKAKKINPAIHIIARTRFFSETKILYELGANEVIPEEFETSVEIFTRVLNKYLIPKEKIEQFIAEIRSESYEMFRSPSKKSTTFSDIKFAIPDNEVNMLWVGQNAFLTNKSIKDINLRQNYGVTLLGVRRGSEIISNPDSSFVFSAGDILLVLGKTQDIAKFTILLKEKE